MILGYCLGMGIPLVITILCVGRCYWKQRKGGQSSDKTRKMERIKIEMARKRAARKRAPDSDWEDVKGREVEAEEARKKRAEEDGEDAPDLGVSKLQDRMPLNSQKVTEADEDVDGIEDAPPRYDWEASGPRYGWESGENSHESMDCTSQEERGLLKHSED